MPRHSIVYIFGQSRRDRANNERLAPAPGVARGTDPLTPFAIGDPNMTLKYNFRHDREFRHGIAHWRYQIAARHDHPYRGRRALRFPSYGVVVGRFANSLRGRPALGLSKDFGYYAFLILH